MFSFMRITIRLFWPLLLAGPLFSCSRGSQELQVEEEAVEVVQFEPAGSFLQLQVGNYWVYESFSVNLETGEETPLLKRDSIYVLKDTVIGRSEYFILEGSRLGQSHRSVLRCSGPEVMDAEGRLLFSTAAVGDTAVLPAARLAEGAESGEACLYHVGGVEVPYGVFDALEYRRTFTLSSSQEEKEESRLRRQSDFFAKGIGLIKYTSFFPNQPLDIEMRLVRCQVK